VHREARALAALGRRAELKQLVAEMLAFPDTGRALGFFLNALAMELRSQGDTVFARELLDRAVSWFRTVPPDEAERSDLHRWFAAALYDADHLDEALPLFQRLVAENPNDSWALMFAGLCLAHRGDRGAAEDIISRLVAAGDSSKWFDRSLFGGNFQAAARIAAALGDRERAVRFLKEHKDHGHHWLSRHLLSKLSKEFHGLLGYAPYMALTQPPD
jgi:tetratricopeptide (TPR) repeat protein